MVFQHSQMPKQRHRRIYTRRTPDCRHMGNFSGNNNAGGWWDLNLVRAGGFCLIVARYRRKMKGGQLLARGCTARQAYSTAVVSGSPMRGCSSSSCVKGSILRGRRKGEGVRAVLSRELANVRLRRDQPRRHPDPCSDTTATFQAPTQTAVFVSPPAIHLASFTIPHLFFIKHVIYTEKPELGCFGEHNRSDRPYSIITRTRTTESKAPPATADLHQKCAIILWYTSSQNGGH